MKKIVSFALCLFLCVVQHDAYPASSSLRGKPDTQQPKKRSNPKLNDSKESKAQEPPTKDNGAVVNEKFRADFEKMLIADKADNKDSKDQQPATPRATNIVLQESKQYDIAAFLETHRKNHMQALSWLDCWILTVAENSYAQHTALHVQLELMGVIFIPIVGNKVKASRGSGAQEPSYVHALAKEQDIYCIEKLSEIHGPLIKKLEDRFYADLGALCRSKTIKNARKYAKRIKLRLENGMHPNGMLASNSGVTPFDLLKPDKQQDVLKDYKKYRLILPPTFKTTLTINQNDGSTKTVFFALNRYTTKKGERFTEATLKDFREKTFDELINEKKGSEQDNVLNRNEKLLGIKFDILDLLLKLGAYLYVDTDDSGVHLVDAAPSDSESADSETEGVDSDAEDSDDEVDPAVLLQVALEFSGLAVSGKKK